MPIARTWYGMTIADKINRAGGRGIIAIGVNVARDTKMVTHRVSGSLARSVHVAEVGYENEDGDFAEATSGVDLLMGTLPAHATPTVLGPAVEVGSWMPYACVEWVGRQHPGVTQGLEMNRGARANLIVKQAFLEEGLVAGV